MQIKFDKNNNNISKDLFKSIPSFIEKAGLLIDREPREIGVFNHGNYNHNVFSENEANNLNNKLINNNLRLYPNLQNI
jgi:hypothetical protein